MNISILLSGPTGIFDILLMLCIWIVAPCFLIIFLFKIIFPFGLQRSKIHSEIDWKQLNDLLSLIESRQEVLIVKEINDLRSNYENRRITMREFAYNFKNLIERNSAFMLENEINTAMKLYDDYLRRLKSQVNST